MRKLRALLYLNLRAALSMSLRAGSKRKRTRAATGLGALVVLALLALYMSGTYSFLIVSQLAPLGLERLVILMMPVLAVAIGTMFTVFAAQGVVFGGRDNDLMLALPVSSFTLMLCRTLALYTENLIFTVFVMLPAAAAYLLGGGSGGVWFFVGMVACTLLLSLLPTLLSLVIGFAVAWLSSRFTRKSGLTTVLYLVFFLGVMALVMRLSLTFNDLSLYAMGLQDAFSGWGLPFLLVMRCCCGGDALALLELAGLCILPFLLAVWAFGHRYKRIVTAMASRSSRSDYKLGRLSAGSCRGALLKKEARRFFTTPSYFLNTGIGLILLVAGGVAALLFRGRLTPVLAQLEGTVSLTPLLAVGACFLAAMAPTTAVCISLEGPQLWILKGAPVSTRQIFHIKVGFHLLLMVPCVLLGSALLALACSLTLLQSGLLLLLTLSTGLLMALLGLFVNLCLPLLDAPNETVVVKQSPSVLVTMLASFAVVLAGGGLWWLIRGVWGDDLALLVPALLFLLLSALTAVLLRTRGERMFSEL